MPLPLRSALAAFFFAIAAIGCSEVEPVSRSSISGSATPAPTGSPKPGDGEIEPIRSRLLELVNEYRAENGEAPLALEPRLTQAAQLFAEAMVNEGFFSHVSPDGSGPGDRILAAGYEWSTWGENIAYGYSTPEAVMQAWVNSSGHRANILGSGFLEIGIGFYRNTWVQDFGAR